MDKSFLEKYAAVDPGSTSNVVDIETDDLGTFGWLRGIKDRCLMLELRRKDGRVLALGYSWLHRVEFEPSQGITLCFGSQRVLLRGRNLNAELRPGMRLFDGIARHRVPWVRQASQAEWMETKDGACVVEAIEW